MAKCGTEVPGCRCPLPGYRRMTMRNSRNAGTPNETSRRNLLKSGAAVALGGIAAQTQSRGAAAQSAGAADPELARVQGARRIVLKDAGVVTRDQKVGDFAQADALIQHVKVREVRPNIAVSDDAAALIDAGDRIVIPGFVDTHSHSYQGLLRNILVNGLLNPDYNRDVQNLFTPAYEAADAYAGMLISALGFIEMGTTAIVDISQVSHTPEHSDALIRALQETGIRAVFAYHRGAGPAAQYPQDIKRLQRSYFSSKGQLLTLALTANLNAPVFALARDVGVPVVQHLVGENVNAPLLALGHAGVLRADRLDVWPINNAPMTVVNMMNPGHIETVFIGGKVKKWRGNLVGVDVARVLRLAEEARDGLLRRANYPKNLLG